MLTSERAELLRELRAAEGAGAEVELAFSGELDPFFAEPHAGGPAGHHFARGVPTVDGDGFVQLTSEGRESWWYPVIRRLEGDMPAIVGVKLDEQAAELVAMYPEQLHVQAIYDAATKRCEDELLAEPHKTTITAGEDGTWLEVMINDDGRVFVTVARGDDEEDDERVALVGREELLYALGPSEPPLYSAREAMREAGVPNSEPGGGVSTADAIRYLANRAQVAEAMLRAQSVAVAEERPREPDCLTTKGTDTDVERAPELPTVVAEQIEQALTIAEVAMQFGQVLRTTEHPDGQMESDTTHTVMLGLLALELAPTKLRRDRLLGAVLVHDLVETFAYDTCTAWGLTDTQRAEKSTRESEALEMLRDLGLTRIVELIEDYERQDSPESRWVRYVDKICPKLTHLLNRGEALRAIGMTRESMLAKHEEQRAELVKMYPEQRHAGALFDATVARCEAELLGATGLRGKDATTGVVDEVAAPGSAPDEGLFSVVTTEWTTASSIADEFGIAEKLVVAVATTLGIAESRVDAHWTSDDGTGKLSLSPVGVRLLRRELASRGYTRSQGQTR
jgi:putative hydrolase of HD superfamily